jgi:hypothetical protein
LASVLRQRGWSEMRRDLTQIKSLAEGKWTLRPAKKYHGPRVTVVTASRRWLPEN